MDDEFDVLIRGHRHCLQIECRLKDLSQAGLAVFTDITTVTP